MLSADLLQQIKHLELKAGHLVTEALSGQYQSAFKGRGMEFDQVREYVPGDDVRSIDWNVTARMHTPFVKVLREERELTIMLMVDVSPSQAFGTVGRSKRETAAELAAILAFLATKHNDKVGLLVFSDHIEQYIPPKKGKAHIWRMIRSVLTHTGTGKATDIAGAADFVAKVLHRRSQCFLISDFWADNYQRSVRLLGQRHDLVLVANQDPLEIRIPNSGIVAFRDAETGRLAYVDTGHTRLREAYTRAARERREGLLNFTRKSGMGLFFVENGASVTAPLAQFLRMREHVPQHKRQRVNP